MRTCPKCGVVLTSSESAGSVCPSCRTGVFFSQSLVRNLALASGVILILFCGGLYFWTGYRTQKLTKPPSVPQRKPPAQTPAKAAEALKKLGASVKHDDQRPGRPVVSVFLLGPKASNAALFHCQSFSELERLTVAHTILAGGKFELGGGPVTDAGLSYISRLTKLEFLSIPTSHVTDAGLTHLSGLKNLKELRIEMTRITDDRLVHLSKLPNLALLDIRGTKVTEAGVAKLKAALPNCEIDWDEPGQN